MTLEKWATWYAGQGYAVFPCHGIDADGKCTCGDPECKSPGKHPHTKNGLKNASTDPNVAASWWRQWPDANIGIRTGAESGIVVIDVDPRHGGDVSMENLVIPENPLPDTVTALTGGGGEHFVYKHPGIIVTNKTNFYPGIDVRGDGGYIIAAPSNHLLGVYRWKENHAPGDIEIAELPAWWRKALTGGKTRERTATTSTTSTSRSETNGLMERAIRYIAAAQGVDDGSRNDTAFKLAGNLVALVGDNGGRLNEGQILDLVRTWNHRNSPPLESAELEKAVKSGLTNGSPRADKPSSVDRQPSTNDDGRQGEPSAEKRREIRYHRITAAELDAGDYELVYLVEYTLVAGQPCIIAGGKKCLKTSLILDLGISLAVGGYFLGKLKVLRPCRVGIMTGESGLATVQETCRRICAAAGYRLGDIDRLFFSEDLPQFGDLNHEDALRKFIMADALEVLVIDPAYMCMPGGDAGNLFAQGELLRGITKVCEETGCTMILAHHTRKTKVDPFAPPELEDIAWAGFQEFARQWLLVGRREQYEPGTGEHRLWLSVGGSAGHSALWALNVDEGVRSDVGGRRWDVEVSAASEARDETRQRRQQEKQAALDERQRQTLDADCSRLVRAMTKYPGGETENVLRQAAGMNGARFRLAVDELVGNDHAVECEITKPCRKTPFQAYRLVTE